MFKTDVYNKRYIETFIALTSGSLGVRNLRTTNVSVRLRSLRRRRATA